MSAHDSTRLAIAAAFVAIFPTFVHGAILSAKRGFADTGANYNNLQATGAGWYYTWGTGLANPGTFDANNYPMFWNAPSQATIDSTLTRSPTYILGYNEPEVSTQANMSVATAISNWTTISNSTIAYNSAHGANIQLVSPAVSDTTAGKAWMTDFHTQAVAAGLKVDAVAFHWYGWSTPDNISQAAANFEGSINWYHNLWNKPVFITEFAIHDWAGSYTDAQIIEANRQFLNIVIPWMESNSYVAGYAWYNWFSDASLYNSSTYEPTVMSYDYIGAVQNGSTYDIGGTNLGEHIAYLNGGQVTMTGTAGTVKYLEALYDPNVTTNTSVVSGTIDWVPSNWIKIQPGATLRKSGAYTMNLTSSTLTVTNNGALDVAQGVLRIGMGLSGNGSLVVSSTGDSIGSTGRLELTGNIYLPNPVTFAQRNDPGGSDGIRNVSGNNTLAGPMTIVAGGNQARVQSDAGQLSLSGPITTNANSARNLYLQGAGNGVVSGIISDNASDANGKINLSKGGAGTWTLTAPNTYTGQTTIAQGILKLGSTPAPTIAHRWSFNNSLVDSVGGANASINDVGANNATLGANQVTLAGGTKTTSDYVKLGSNLLPNTNTPVTIELWATQNSVQNWSRIFDFGTDSNENLFMSWTMAADQNTDRVGWKDGGVETSSDNTNKPYTTGTEYHIVLELTPAGNSTTVTWFSSASSNANLGSAKGTFTTTKTLAAFTDNEDNLGRSFYSDNTANASYDEVRLWNAALDLNTLEILHDAGPDADINSLNLGGNGALPSTTAVNITVGGATLDLNSINQTIGSLTGVAGSSVLLGSGTLTLGGNGTSTTFSGNISGTGGIIKNGGGTFTLAGSNTYGGTTSINGGILKGGAANVLPNGPGKGDVSIATGAKLDLGGFNQTFNGLSGNGIVDNTVAANPLLTVGANDANSTFTGVIQNTVGSISLFKTGSGIMTLSGNNAYNGTTTVDNGALIIDGAIVSIGSASILGGSLQVNSPSATMHDITGGVLTVGDGSAAASLTADSVAVETLTISAGSILTISPIPGGPLSDSLLPVPEPSTWILILFAAVGPLFIGQRRK
jgi:autotransporter-associated beta strand protein